MGALLWPSLHTGLAGDTVRLWAIGSLLAGALSWTVGSIVSRRARLQVNSFVAAAWEMLLAGAFCTGLGTVLGQWPDFHLTTSSVGSLAYLITGGSLLGFTGFIYLIDNVPVAKVASYTYVNPVVAVLLGIFLLHERPEKAEFTGMAAIVVAVYLLTHGADSRQDTAAGGRGSGAVTDEVKLVLMQHKGPFPNRERPFRVADALYRMRKL